MKVICAIGMQGGAEIVRRLLELIGSQHELYLLDVIDSGPRNTLEDYLHGPRHLRRPPPPATRARQAFSTSRARAADRRG